MIESYKLTLTHYAVDKATGEKFRLDLPITVEQVFDRTNGCGSPVILNHMLDEMKYYVLTIMNETEE